MWDANCIKSREKTGSADCQGDILMIYSAVSPSSRSGHVQAEPLLINNIMLLLFLTIVSDFPSYQPHFFFALVTDWANFDP